MVCKTLLLTASLVAVTACQPARRKTTEADGNPPATAVNAPIPYDLLRPTDQFRLSGDLREVSGLSFYKPGRLALIQDELAVVFIYDLSRRAVVDEHIFGRKGDYEGVEFVNGDLYMLRSDGELYTFAPTDGSIKTLGGGGVRVRHIKIDLPGKNDVEGLGYDPQLDALLLATKDADKGGSDKPIYFFSLKNQNMFAGPVLKQDVLWELAGDGSDDEVKPSAIAVHPKTGEYYVLASAGHRLLVLTRTGKLRSSTPLPEALFSQPEGICFLPDGTLFIANEGSKTKSGTLLRFAQKK